MLFLPCPTDSDECKFVAILLFCLACVWDDTKTTASLNALRVGVLEENVVSR